MSSKNDLGGEDFDKITFVRMEDVQPSCGNQLIVNYVNELPNDKETCSDDSYIHYLDEDSNIGSMVSIKSSTVLVEHDYSEKYIIPDSITDIHLVSILLLLKGKILPGQDFTSNYINNIFIWLPLVRRLDILD